MNTENVWIVVLLVIVIVLLSNLAMFAMVRGWRGKNSDWFENMRSSINTPFKKDDDPLHELHKRVEELQKPGKEE